MANVLPRSTRLIYERYQTGDVRGSHAYQQKIVEVSKAAPNYGIQGLKYAMDLKGFFGGPTRLPLLSLSAQQETDIELLFHDVDDNLDTQIKNAI